MKIVAVYVKVGLIIFLYFVCYAVYNAYLHPIPALGDSWDYHIPIAKLILAGDIFAPHNVQLSQWYYPGSGEIVNALFIFLNIPLTISNLFAVIVLFFCCWKLASVFGLDYYESLFFAMTICTLNVFVRWYNAVSVDVWLSILVILSVILLERPKKAASYFLKLGVILGMLIGTKYTGFYYILILLLFYWRSILNCTNSKRLTVFFIPVLVLGFSWYIRNWILFKNPFYPVYFLGLPYQIDFKIKSWQILLSYPVDFFNAFFGEFKVWVLTLPIALISLIKSLKQQMLSPLTRINKLLLLGILGLVVFLISPMDEHPWIMVSSFRYSFTAFIMLILATFLLAKKYNKSEYLYLLSIASMIMVTSFMYYPKLLLMYAPVSLITIYLVNRFQKHISKVFN